MSRYNKTKPNIQFNGKTSIRYSSEYVYNQIRFNINNSNLIIEFVRYRKRLPSHTFIIENFKQYSANDIINMYPNMGRHFEDGIYEIYHYFNLDLGFTIKMFK